MSSRRSAPLDRLLAQVRAQRPPSPPTSDLPPRLRAEFRSAAAGWRAAAPRPARAANRRWLPALAVAAAAALALVLARSGGLPGPVAPPAASALLDGQPLDVGALVVATDRARRVEHAGRASWELEPGSRARVLSYAGGVLRVSLEQGSLTAEVQPSARPESFVVQAEGTEVAVHGTRFRVSLVGDHVRVSVARGQVQVRPLALAPAALPIPGTALRAGMQADFWAGKTEPAAAVHAGGSSEPRAGAPAGVEQPTGDRPLSPAVAALSSELPAGAAARASVPGPLPERQLAPAPSAARAAHPALPETSRGAKPGAAPSAAAAAISRTPGALSQATARGTAAAMNPAPAPATPVPPASVEQALQAVTEHVQRCFREQLPGSSEIGIEVSTRLGLWVEADGELLRADFEPPLAPAVERCVAAELANLRVARSPEGFRVERALRLRR